MMTTTIDASMDGRDREDELTALSGHHTVVLQRWRELEDFSGTLSSLGDRRSFGSGREDEEERDERGFSRWSREREEDGEELGRRPSRREDPFVLGVRRQIDSGSRHPSQRNDSPRGTEWLDEAERERVRPVREWMHLASRRSPHRREDRERDLDVSSRDGSITDYEDGLPEHVRREQLRLRGWEARLELIRRMVGERRRELRGLSDNRAVSEFAHRARLQLLLRGRFLHNESPTEEERLPSVAARELNRLRQHHHVSGLRERFRSRLENIVRGQVSNHFDTLSSPVANSFDNIHPQFDTEGDLPSENYEQSQPSNFDITILEVPELHMGEPDRNMEMMGLPESTGQEGNGQNYEHHGMESNHGTADEFGELHAENGEESDAFWQENNQHWSQGSPGNDVEEDSEDWHEYGSNMTAENWQEHSDPLRNDDHLPMERINRYLLPYDESVYSMELRELISRRSVSNLLQSQFRESLDHLIQSYVQRQDHSPFEWDIQQNIQNPAMPMRDLNQEGSNANTDQQDSVSQAPGVPLPPIPPQPNLQQEQHRRWTRYRMHHSVIESDAISDLRTEMARLQHGMNHMRRMLGACMDMQLELQRSVRQEVSAALNCSVDAQGGNVKASDGSMWNLVRKGICCICCDCHIDSLLYRCGHMCTCLACANELVLVGDKCPLCRAPIIEVIRAYSIL